MDRAKQRRVDPNQKRDESRTAENNKMNNFDLKETITPNKAIGLWRMMTGYHWIYGVATLSVGIAALSRALAYYLIAYFVDDVLPSEQIMSLLPWVAAGFVGLALAQGSFTFLGGRLAAKTSEGITRRLRNYLYDHLQRLSFTYHDRMQTGELLSRATSDVDAMRRLYSEQLIGIGRIATLFFVSFGALLVLNVRLALLSVIVIPIVVGLSIFFFRKMEKVYQAYQEQEATLSSRLQENLSGVRVVKAFARQEYEIDRFETENWKKYLRGKSLITLHATFWPTTDIMCGIQMLAGFYLGAMMAINGEITVGSYLAYVGLVIQLIWPIRGLGRLIAQMSTGFVSMERLHQIIRQEREPLELGSVDPGGRLRGEVIFDHVYFAYDTPATAEERAKGIATGEEATKRRDDEAKKQQNEAEDLAFPRQNGLLQSWRRWKKQGDEEEQKNDSVSSPPTILASLDREYVLQDINLHVKPGMVVGLLGATGSGKTSLINLLPRFYDYTGGSIKVDGVELRDYSRSYLRSQIGMVQQEPFLFSTTIRNNITYGLGREVSDEEVEAAARAAAVHDVILSFPKGYETMVGERGVTLSGGQKQRVTIARTLLKDPSILILDDATSSVDTETDAEIRGALRMLMENRTTFIIAHRVQSVMEADQIMVMDRGKIVQMGTHHRLLNQPGIYQRVYDLQARIEADLEQEIADAVETADAKAEQRYRDNGSGGVPVKA
jgi:ABC-type multidrug transport system fused ATPase/permease subunit